MHYSNDKMTKNLVDKTTV